METASQKSLRSLHLSGELSQRQATFPIHPRLIYETKTKYLTAKQVLQYRDDAWTKYFTNPKYLDRIKQVFGQESYNNIINLTKIKLKRKLLGD